MKDALPVLKKIRTEHPALQYVLQDVEVVMPDSMVATLSFPAGKVRYRKDHAVFLDMITTVAYMRQYEKEVKRYRGNGTDFMYVECDGIDYEIAYGLFGEYMYDDPQFESYDDLEKIMVPDVMHEALGETKSDG